MKVALLTSQKPNQVALCHKIAERFELRAVLVSGRCHPRSASLFCIEQRGD
jgi:hypothetical protein